MWSGRGGDGQKGESGKLTDPYAKHTLENDECTEPPLVTHTCSSWHMWQAGRGAEQRGRGNRGRETSAHMMCRAAHIHVGTLFPDTHREARKRGSQAYMRKRHMQSEPGRQQ